MFDLATAMLLARNVTLAQSPVDSASVLIQYSAVGVLAIASMGIARILFKRLEEAAKQERAQFEKTLELEREARRRAEDELRTLNASIRDQYVPALERATGVIAQTLRASRRDDLHDDPAR